MTAPPVKQLLERLKVNSEKLTVSILQPEKLDAEFIEKLKSFNADFCLVFAYNKIFRKNILDIPRLGIIGIHPSFLPQYRGPSPFQTALLNGEPETGATLYCLREGVDDGPIVAESKPVSITDDDTFVSLASKLADISANLAIETVPKYVDGKITPWAQDESQATYEGWFRANEAKLNFASHVSRVHDLIRAADPAPGAWTTLDGKKVQLFGSKKHLVRTFGAVKGKVGEITEIGAESMRITAQGGQVEVSKVKAEETKKLAAAEWAKGAGVAVGTILGT